MSKIISIDVGTGWIESNLNKTELKALLVQKKVKITKALQLLSKKGLMKILYFTDKAENQNLN